jgi:transposase-like protein
MFLICSRRKSVGRTMDHGNFVEWFSAIECLSGAQRAEVERALSGQQPLNQVVQVLESRIGADRQCPHCASPGATRRGFANNLRRYHCGNCKKTFNRLTGTPLARLRHKGRWHEFGASLAADETIVQSAQRCTVANSTAFRWRHRFLEAVTSVVKLSGIVEADETFVLESHKGSRSLNRKPRKRGGSAKKRGLSSDQVPVLVAVDRSGATECAILQNLSAACLENALRPLLNSDTLLVTDGCTSYPPCAAALGITHEAINLSAGERVRGEIHIQTANSRHERLKSFLRKHRGVATRYLDSYLRWYKLTILPKTPSARSVLATALGLTPVAQPQRIANAN